ncbi:cytochrome c oxidase assembly protein COX20, mitochondrial [Tupaia chinensis]|uniref:cytochrome c oxidase assembly protein COX20, mitochondrial n=1 Tax=Tupaia chinensis TaxID=246437 RepID=UPI0003C8CFC1|nr:cytochrome c oxidase assembly protein COX20, mitochondrial [Tupaia chinensis]
MTLHNDTNAASRFPQEYPLEMNTHGLNDPTLQKLLLSRFHLMLENKYYYSLAPASNPRETCCFGPKCISTVAVPMGFGGDRPFKLLGILDVENIPCARESILYGSLGSVVAGLGHFLLTSRIRRSCDVGVGGFILVTLGCWFHCRYNHAKQRIQERIAREGIKNMILYESTHLDPERKQSNSNRNS